LARGQKAGLIGGRLALGFGQRKKRARNTSPPEIVYGEEGCNGRAQVLDFPWIEVSMANERGREFLWAPGRSFQKRVKREVRICRKRRAFVKKKCFPLRPLTAGKPIVEEKMLSD